MHFSVNVDLVASAAAAEGFPRDRLLELAMVGRSNVGKSSLINALVKRDVARTSAAPGKTRLAHFYRVAAEGAPPFFLVDLPGYGYARGGDAARAGFDRLAGEYFGARRKGDGDHSPSFPQGDDLRPCFVLQLVDSRHPDLEPDRRAFAWLVDQGLEVQVVATKLDKLTQAERRRHLGELERRYSGPVVGVSTHTGEGLDELWTLIVKLLRRPSPTPPPRPSAPRSTSRP